VYSTSCSFHKLHNLRSIYISEEPKIMGFWDVDTTESKVSLTPKINLYLLVQEPSVQCESYFLFISYKTYFLFISLKNLKFWGYGTGIIKNFCLEIGSQEKDFYYWGKFRVGSWNIFPRDVITSRGKIFQDLTLNLPQ
jgi:hypothetical protein